MRIVLTCVSGYSHLYFMVPLARAATAAGHEVAISSAGELAPVAAAAGLHLLPAGPGRLRLRTEMMRRHRAETSADVRDWRTGARIFGDLAPRLRLAQLVEVTRAYRPDLIVCESLELAGPLVAKLTGTPHAVQSIGPFYADSFALLWKRAEPLYRAELGRAVGPDDVLERYLDVCPASVQTPDGVRLPGSLPVRIRAYHGAAGPDPTTAGDAHGGAGERSGGCPRVLVTFGTVSNDAIGELVGSAELLARRGAQVTMTLGPRGWFDWSRLDAAGTDRPGEPAGGPTAHRPGVRTVDYVPLGTELPRTDVLIHHGGSNTMRAAIEHAVPTLVIPHGAEQYRNARWVAGHGLGRMLMPADVSPDTVAAHVSALVEDPGVRERLRAARAAWLAMPDPADVLERLVRECGTAPAHSGGSGRVGA